MRARGFTYEGATIPAVFSPRRRTERQDDDRPPTDSDGPVASRAASPVVGVVVVVGVTVLLAATVAGVMSVGEALGDPAPRATFDAEVSATDSWPEGQRLRVVHGGGERLAVANLSLVVSVPRVDASPRIRDLPARRLSGERVQGRDIFDGTYAGVDGALDATDGDGYWAGGEPASVRIAQAEVDIRPGDRVAVRVIHRPTDAVIWRTEVVAT